MELDDLPKERLKELIFNETTIFKQIAPVPRGGGGGGSGNGSSQETKEDTMQTN